VGKDAVAKYMPRPVERPRRPPSQTWGTFVRTHAVGTIAIDFFTVPTVTFGVLYAFFVLSLERRRVIHVNVTEHPTAEWAAQQIVEAVGPDEGLVRLIRDRDKIFAARRRLRLRTNRRSEGGEQRGDTSVSERAHEEYGHDETD